MRVTTGTCFSLLASTVFAKWGLPFEAILPLIDETAKKVHQLAPRQAQTGPAARNDREVMDKHLQMLADMPHLQHIYKLLSESISNL